ncbi:MAG: primosome assembly protein PriA, partial [Mycobacteriales bacterium]
MTVADLRIPIADDAPAAGAVVELPVARVAVDVSLAHLDRLFDYAVPAALADLAQPGVRVRVRFAGRLVDGYVVERAAETAHAGRLAPLAKVVSGEAVLAGEVMRLCRAVADRYAGTLGDVLRLAVPPRHARVEAVPSAPAAPPPGAPAPTSWSRYVAAESFLGALASGGSPRAVWRALPGPTWPAEVAAAAQATLAG